MFSYIEQLAQMTEHVSAVNWTADQDKTKRLVPAHVDSLKPYKPGRPPKELTRELGLIKYINLASNENPLGPPQSALQSIQEAITGVSRYPDLEGLELRQSLADRYGIWLENVAIGSGSESIMANIIRAFLHGDDEVVTSAGTFIGLYVLVRAQGVKLTMVPLKNYRYDLDAIADAVTEKTKIIYLCNPNNPTGTIFTRHEFESFVKKIPEHILIILDEAYFEFAMGVPDFPDSMSYRLDNVLTLRTFSKAYGMAGMRLGYGLGHDYLIGYVNRIKLPFEPNVLAQAAGLAALGDYEFLRRTLENNTKGMTMLVDEFNRMGLEHIPSCANHIMVPFENEEKVKELHTNMLKQGIAIRPLSAFGLPHCWRVTIGLPEENELFIRALHHSL